ncbi:MAG TPA: hypothetical protein VE890_12855 [Thermoguttaceae bacterium]|nr:hypothetical protein [Thermoguttaceae bacterium]
MRCLAQSLFITLLASTAVIVGSAPSWAQTENETGTETETETVAPAEIAEHPTDIPSETTEEGEQPPAPALDGYCPVCIVQLHEWVKGSPAYQTTYDGRVYYFPGEKYKKLFLADPERFAPALGGDCVVDFARTGRRTPGSIRRAVTHDGRLYLFSNDQAREMFSAHPDAYADLDLAFHGECPVSRAELNTQTPGRPELISRRNGFRYYFSSHDLREKFLANPDEYEMRPGDEEWPGGDSALENVETSEEPIE